MNRMYIATANRTGTEGDITFNGQFSFYRTFRSYNLYGISWKIRIISAEIDTKYPEIK